MSTLSQTVEAPVLRTRIGTDVVVFTIREGALHLLCRRTAAASPWALPGELVETDEELDACAQRALSAQTGLNGLYLEQLYTFGPRAGMDATSGDQPVTVAYFALAPFEPPAQVSGGACWFPVTKLPDLNAAQARIVALALQRLRAKLDYSTIAFELMPEKFTLSELQGVYETVLASPLDKRNFRKRILGLELLEETGEQRRTGSHRPARLYRYRSSGNVQFIK